MKTYTKEKLDQKIVSNLESIIEKFRGKNESYGDQADGLYNFRETAIEFRELFGEDLLEAQFKVAMVLFHKHFVTLKKNGLKDPEFKDRMGDWVAYGAIMMAMGDLMQEEKYEG